jgi:transposase-like protein
MGKRGPKSRFIDVACPNEQCSLFGIAGKGNVTVYGTYTISSGKVGKYVCHTCGTRFCDRTNTAFYDSRTNEEKIKLALKMAMRGMSVLGIAEIVESKPSTLSTWISKAAKALCYSLWETYRYRFVIPDTRPHNKFGFRSY